MAAERRNVLAACCADGTVRCSRYRLSQKAFGYCRLSAEFRLECGADNRCLSAWVFLSIIFALISTKRLSAYRDEVGMWRDVLPTSRKPNGPQLSRALLTRWGGARPMTNPNRLRLESPLNNSRGQADLRSAPTTDARLQEGIAELRIAVELNSADADAISNLAQPWRTRAVTKRPLKITNAPSESIPEKLSCTPILATRC